MELIKERKKIEFPPHLPYNKLSTGKGGKKGENFERLWKHKL